MTHVCNRAKCGHNAHNEDTDETMEEQKYCYLPLWHPERQLQTHEYKHSQSKTGGHIFPHSHGNSRPYHVIFSVDVSGSMSSSDVTPNDMGMFGKHPNRVGAVYESCYSFIRYRTEKGARDMYTLQLHDHDAWTVCLRQQMGPEEFVTQYCGFGYNGENDFDRVCRDVG